MEKENTLKPIPLWQSLLLFGIPGLMLYLGLYYAVPFLLKLGYSEVFLFLSFWWGPFILLLPVSIILFKQEQKKQPGLSLKKRFRLNRLTKKDWIWVICGILFVLVFDFIIMEPVSKWLATKSFFSAPDHFPVLFHPLKKITVPLTEFLGVPLKGNWLLLFIIIIFHSITIVAEEFMWRGYILPRQEKVYGKWAWLPNGLLWAYVVHFFMIWNFISFLPSMLLTPYLAQKTKNTWVSLMIHGIPNSLLWILILTGVLGAG